MARFTLTILGLSVLACDAGKVQRPDIRPVDDMMRFDVLSSDGVSLPTDGESPTDRGTDIGQDMGPDTSAGACKPIPGASYSKRGANKPCGCDPAKHGDMNLLLRSWKATPGATKGLINVGGAADSMAPQLCGLFSDERVPQFPGVYQVEQWDWGCNCPKGYITQPEVTLAGMTTSPDEIIHTPKSGYDIGAGHTAMVIHAAKNTITLKYTTDDDVVEGYTVHVAGICVDPALQTLYDACHAAGRTELPVLKSSQAFGRASSGEILVSIRDTGSWMDPRIKKDWWQGK